MKKLIFLVAILMFCQSTARSQSSPIVVDVSKPMADVQPTMWGIFFEDINFAADGGLYAELIKNRSFEFNAPLMGWTEQKSNKFSMNKESGSAMIVNRGEQEQANPRFARITVNAERGYGLSNEGFRGMGIKNGVRYNFSVFARQGGGSTKLRIELVDMQENQLAEVQIAPSGTEWKKYTATFTPARLEPKAKLKIWFEGVGSLDLDMISLFPEDTWKNRPNGLRADLVQLLSDMNPGFLRFPGGCIVEGRELATRYQWKKTVGKVEERKMIVNRWNTEFSHRPAIDYFQTFGLGFFEYFQLAEDIGAEPLPILSCGMACQFNSAEVVPMDQLDPYVQDALDLIEFANGDGQSAWGKVRIEMGHTDPFNLKMIGIGNEQWGPQYIERYKAFVKAIKEKYPKIKVVTSNGPFPSGELFEFADQQLRSLDAEIIDEHYYNKPEWFLKNSTRYDAYPRSGTKIFAGEYAAQSVATGSPDNKNNWECALAEAAFMTGLERNADVVSMCSYAPLFAHTEGWQWTPDLIWFDNLKSYGTPNYYVQKLFATNRGTQVLPMLQGTAAITGQQGVYASAALDKASGEVILKIVNATANAITNDIEIKGASKISPTGKITVLKSEKLDAANSLSDPFTISPVEQNVAIKGKKFSLSLAPYSLSVVKIKTQ